MISRQRPLGFMVALALTFALVLSPGFTGAAQAASEDVAMFYDDLSQVGQWVEYGNYGAVWRPTGVAEDWRPYTNGRWVPTNDGNVFESDEPWAWATYHYGNWMPTEDNGWVWVPGRTWYPSTVEWRTSPESTPVDASYVGWAPTPPPNYEPIPACASPMPRKARDIPICPGRPRSGFAGLASLDLRQGGPVSAGFRAAICAELFLYELRDSGASVICAGIFPSDAVLPELCPTELLPAGFLWRAGIRPRLL